jgi:DNA-binding NarL/FixJ family response regulator
MLLPWQHAAIGLPLTKQYGVDKPSFIVAEDEPMLQLMLKRLVTYRYPTATVHVAASAAETIQLVQQGQATIVITDYYLEDGSAHDVLTAVQAIPEPIAVYVLSGDATVAASVLAAGAAAFVHKPFHIEPLLALLQEHAPLPH